MMHSLKFILAVAAVAGVSTLAAPAQAQSAKSDAAAAKPSAGSAAGKSTAAVDDFEENRRAHMQKSKENNAKKGAE
ncbi:hypothetical protein [Methylobacterium sp. Leaf118]|uniref:hypothetical protein n=1 Tax=Methylobacterium sp. Leaf118 TaxID=2876562 RepID=UPI001E5CB4BF|nr:hypothetical protein [Methylobacterium sp. Leaf118]